MRHRIILAFVLGAASMNCSPRIEKVEMVKLHPNCPEVPATTFEKTDVDMQARSLKFGELVTLGEIAVKSDPQIISGVSQGLRDEQWRTAEICAAKERGELKTPEQIAYARQVAMFVGTNPTAAEMMEFYKQFPFPLAQGVNTKGKDDPQIASIRRAIEEGYAVKKSIEQEYRLHRQQNTFQANEGNLLASWNGRTAEWQRKVISTLAPIDTLLVEQFKDAHISDGLVPPNESPKWVSVNKYLRAKIDFLTKYLDKVQ